MPDFTCNLIYDDRAPPEMKKMKINNQVTRAVVVVVALIVAVVVVVVVPVVVVVSWYSTHHIERGIIARHVRARGHLVSLT